MLRVRPALPPLVGDGISHTSFMRRDEPEGTGEAQGGESLRVGTPARS